ncbi:hypothetical protein [Polaromonas jejuensis]|uniref:Uncharacterized protein n=1 Tax=Polaromonas jejuensis TaxID=457502 RepID=A0ABW0QK38_9BURK|nr:hypothetical protein [Polaromonas jejuensis]
MDFNFKLTEQESNLVLTALANRPYAEVVNLIGKLQGQANVQLEAAKPVNNNGDLKGPTDV